MYVNIVFGAPLPNDLEEDELEQIAQQAKAAGLTYESSGEGRNTELWICAKCLAPEGYHMVVDLVMSDLSIPVDTLFTLREFLKGVGVEEKPKWCAIGWAP